MNDFIILIKNGNSGEEVKFVDVLTGEVKLFESGQAAAEKAKGLNDWYRETNAPHRARVLKSDAEKQTVDWRQRESAKFDCGKYQRPVWVDTNWYDHDHFAHPAQEDARLIAYTPDEEHGIADRQLRCSVKHYLEKYFCSSLDEADVNYWVAEHLDRYGPTPEVKFATTPGEIEAVYTAGKADCNGQHYPPSCMSHKTSHYDSSIHPVRVYGAGDLAVAYLDKADGSDGIACRVLCWPEKKRFGRFFPENNRSRRLQKALEALGYSEGKFSGAKLLKIEDDHDNYVMPYIDWHDWVTSKRDHFVIEGAHEDFCPHNTNGLAEESGVRCYSCNDRIDEDDCYSYDGDHYCESCFSDRAFYCERCGDATSNDDRHESPDGDSYCEYCFNRSYFTCESCDTAHAKGDGHATDDGQSLCDDCYAGQYTHCTDCDVELNFDDAHKLNGSHYCGDCRNDHPEANDDEDLSEGQVQLAI